MHYVNLPVNYLKASLLVAASNDIRYYLNGVLVRVRENDVLIAATDGHRLSVFQVKNADGAGDNTPAEVIIPREVLKGIKPLNRHFENCTLNYDAAQPLAKCRLAALKDGDRVFTPIDGKFPVVMRVIPDKVSGKKGFFNPFYLADFANLVRIASGMNTGYPDVRDNGIGCAAVTYAALPDWVGAIMPMDWEAADKYQRPAWL